MQPVVRKLPPPDYPAILNSHRLRDTRGGIQRLADAGHNVAHHLARLEAKRIRQADGRRAQRWAKYSELPFIGWDGEGWSDTDGEHRYNYMANSLGMFIEEPQLTTQGIFNLLLSTAHQYKDAIHVIYGGGYDVTHWVRDLPLEHRNALRELGKVTVELDGGSYTMTYIPHKWFTLRGKWADQWVTITVYDVMTFFQTSFINALNSRGIPVPQEVIDGKHDRGSFTVAMLDRIKRYTGEELRLLVQLCDTLRSEFHEAGMPVRKYYGPGAVADAVNKQYRIPRHMMPVSRDMELLCQRAYFGGRFEPLQIGHYDGPVYQADICSAYPDKIRELPSLAGAYWEYRPEYTGELGIWKCSHHGDANWTLANPLPWRSPQGSVGFPTTVDEVWLWTFEAAHAHAHPGGHVGEGWVLVTPSNEKPFQFIPGMYDTRKAWKAAGRGGHWALKLALNSLYGKMAQRVGGRDGGPPKYHQLAWAGMVTSMTRAQLWEAMAQKPHTVVAVETDSVMTTERLDLDYGIGLGQWELSEFEWVTYLQSGIYWSNAGDHLKAKTRGVDASELSHSAVLRYLSGDLSTPLYTSVHRFIALTNPDLANYGQWVDSSRELTVNGGKRWHVPGSCWACAEGRSLAEGLHRMVPAPDMGVGPSKPHPLPWRKDVAPNIFDPESAETKANEDWSEYY